MQHYGVQPFSLGVQPLSERRNIFSVTNIELGISFFFDEDKLLRGESSSILRLITVIEPDFFFPDLMV